MRKAAGIIAVLWGLGILTRAPGGGNAAYQAGVTAAKVMGLILVIVGARQLYKEFFRSPAAATPEVPAARPWVLRLGLWGLTLMVIGAVLRGPVLNLRAGALMAQAESAHRSGDLARESRLLDQVLALDPAFPAALVQRAVLHAVRGEADQALADADAALKRVPGDEMAHAARCVAWTLKKEWSRALAACEESERAATKPLTSGYAAVGQAKVKSESGRYKDAMADVERALARSPGLPAALEARVSLSLILGLRETALGDIQKLVELDPGVKPAYDPILAKLNDPAFATPHQLIGRQGDFLAALAVLQLRHWRQRRSWASSVDELALFDGAPPLLKPAADLIPDNRQVSLKMEDGRLLMSLVAPEPLKLVLTASGDQGGFTLAPVSWDGGSFEPRTILPEPEAPRRAASKRARPRKSARDPGT
ncbi:MAG: hypothetical protein HY927_13900 [Elusimicrobia bacterium]|nr:hypothetical protein [Elusimicrobiota bacterium]